jgi:hypothetical protein
MTMSAWSLYTQAGTMVTIMMTRTSSIITIMKSSMLAPIMMPSLWCTCTHHDIVVMTSRPAALRAQARW